MQHTLLCKFIETDCDTHFLNVNSIYRKKPVRHVDSLSRSHSVLSVLLRISELLIGMPNYIIIPSGIQNDLVYFGWLFHSFCTSVYHDELSYNDIDSDNVSDTIVLIIRA